MWRYLVLVASNDVEALVLVAHHVLHGLLGILQVDKVLFRALLHLDRAVVELSHGVVIKVVLSNSSGSLRLGGLIAHEYVRALVLASDPVRQGVSVCLQVLFAKFPLLVVEGFLLHGVELAELQLVFLSLRRG